MKLTRTIFFAPLFALGEVGCMDIQSQGAPTAYVVGLDSILDDGTATYKLDTKTLPGLTDINNFDESPLHFMWNADLVAETIEGSIAYDVSVTNESEPALRLSYEDGVARALDYDSFATLSSYSEFYEVQSQVATLGFPELQIVTPSVKVYFRPSLREEDSTQTVQMNAFYFADIDGFGVGSPSSLEAMPLGANRLVLAHEYGHRVFDRVFTRPDGPCNPDAPNDDRTFPGRFSLWAGIRGLNEGFADIFAFSITGGLDVLGGSLSELVISGERALAPRVPGYVPFEYSTIAAHCKGDMYCVGTLWARAIVQAYLDEAPGNFRDEAARKQLAMSVMQALRATPAAMRANPDFLPAITVENSDCEYGEDYSADEIAPFLVAFMNNYTHPSKPKACEYLEKSFGKIFDKSMVSGCGGAQ